MGSMLEFEADNTQERSTSSGDYAKGILLGLVGGAAVGAIVALLTTPKSGREIREDLGELRTRSFPSGGEVVAVAGEQARQIVNDGRRRADTIIDDARSRASSLLGDAEQIVQEARRKAKTATGKGADEVRAKADQLAEATRAGVEAFKEELGEDPRPQKTEAKGAKKTRANGAKKAG